MTTFINSSSCCHIYSLFKKIIMSESLPKIPIFNFPNITQSRFHVPQKLRYINGYAIVPYNKKGIGGTHMDLDNTKYLETSDNTIYDPRLTYGNSIQEYQPIVLPRYVVYNKKHLIFKAYVKDKETGFNLTIQNSLRFVNIIYYLEDDTLTIIEPHVENSGLLQGKIINRKKIVKDGGRYYWHWKDFNIGIDVKIQGLTFHIINCDDYTKDFLKSQGIELGKEENFTSKEENVNQNRYKYATQIDPKDEASRNLQRYLIYGDKTLKFDVIWEYDEIREFSLYYYLYDKTISLKEINIVNINSPFYPVFLSRKRIPKDWKKYISQSPINGHISNLENDDDYYSAKDLIVGNKINILGRIFLICDCDSNTRNYYKSTLNIIQNPQIKIEQNTINRKENNYHCKCEEAEEKTCLPLYSNNPSKNLIQYNLNTNKYFRYLCNLISVHPEDTERKFILQYNLADSTIRIDEISIKNSGIGGGRFYGPEKILIPGNYNQHYTPEMFYIGAIVEVKRCKFRIIGADLYIYNYMKKFPDKFPLEVIENIKNYHMQHGNLNDHLDLLASAENTEGQNITDNYHINNEGNLNREDNESQLPILPTYDKEKDDTYLNIITPHMNQLSMDTKENEIEESEILQENIIQNKKNIAEKKVTFTD